MQELRDASSISDDGAQLRAGLDRDGYLFFRGLLDRAVLDEVRRQVVGVLAADGWLQPGRDPADAVPSDIAEPERAPATPHYLATYAEIQRLQAFHELALASPLLAVLERLFGEPVATHPLKIARIGVPTPERWTTPAHQDFTVVQGTADFVTAWIPFGDCPREMGGLKVLEGSHRLGERTPVPAVGVGGFGVDVDEDDERWATTEYRAGDVLVFHSMTVHGALPNVTDRIRLSGDFRYQSVRSPMREAFLMPHCWPNVPDYDELAAGWTTRRSIEAPPGVTVVPNDVRAEPVSSLVTLEPVG